MFTKTSAISRNHFFRSVPKDGPKSHRIHNLSLTRKPITHYLAYDKPIYLTATSGITMLIVSEKVSGPFEKFILHGTVKLFSNVYFNVTSISESSQVQLKHAPDSQAIEQLLTDPIPKQSIEPEVQLSEIYALYYQVKKAPYHFGVDRHNYCELTIVEQGQLETTVDGVSYHLERNDAILYQKNQSHSQTVKVDETTTYITILFDMTLEDPRFFDRVFHLDSGQVSQLEGLIRISEEEDTPYKNDQLLARLKLLILSLISETRPTTGSVTSMKEKYDEDTIQQITDYIKQSPGIRVIDISHHFGMSRSNIQALFQRFVGMQPRAYIEEQRLKQAKILMRDSSHSLTEISRMVGYQSLPAFSRSFKHAFGYPPSEYAKKIYKQI
ncbi:AraC family transcriptional regulator [Streptococcus ovuberis]|uniref:AraC family transcriptional regulator n=1 Tax=Streptococcus ovuberis TaxID=1936207 RepID=A0A7X6S277_9STRE|nr:AraC family transcriptional regulator [Streptococcus ovuberis]NKZ20956.1 AraC family transcriptional regulator [Streptococcus ovuberis]